MTQGAPEAKENDEHKGPKTQPPSSALYEDHPIDGPIKNTPEMEAAFKEAIKRIEARKAEKS